MEPWLLLSWRLLFFDRRPHHFSINPRLMGISWTSNNKMQRSFVSNTTSISDRSDSVEVSFVPLRASAPCTHCSPNLLTRLYRIQYVAASIDSCGIHAIATQCLVKNFPPASSGIVHTICKILQSYNNFCGWPASGGNWHTTSRFTSWDCPWKKPFWDHEKKKIPSFVGTTHSKSKSRRSKTICLQLILLFVLESFQHPSRICPFALRNFPYLSVLVPNTHQLRFELSQINEVANLVLTPIFPLDVFRFSKMLVIVLPGLALLFAKPHFKSCSCRLSQVTTHSNMSLQFNNQLLTTPFSAITEPNLAATANLCASGVNVQCSSLVRTFCVAT